MSKDKRTWTFIDQQGTFELSGPDQVNYLYFPLMNEAGLMSCVTPRLHGDIKINHHAWLTQPLSVEDLHHTNSTRNFWLRINGQTAWSATGGSAAQLMDEQGSEETTLRAGPLWHQMVRLNRQVGLEAHVTNFIPATDDPVELMNIQITNITDQPLEIEPTAAIPIFGRSADNLRDHRHVTALLNRIECTSHGVRVCPTLSFDERGHHPNHLVYQVMGLEGDGTPPQGFIPILEDFIGEGKSLAWPKAVTDPEVTLASPGDCFEGYEAIGGLRFAKRVLQPRETCSFVLLLGIASDPEKDLELVEKFGSQDRFDFWLEQTRNHWQGRISQLSIATSDDVFNQWFKWVCLQPIFRRQFGNSYLPYHDYGKGGRGWRDLWQDILAVLVMEAKPVDQLLFDNFAGVRLDGSNATIIGSRPGEFKADRNNIPRVWMDHGAWPLLTTLLYINQTGDLEFLLRKQAYFKDNLLERAQAADPLWHPSQGTSQLTSSGEVYEGTLLEHLLVQHLTAFFNVGDHNHIRLEGADWNDGLDMAEKRGESVAFTAMYASNFRKLGELAQSLKQNGQESVLLGKALLDLLDTLVDPVDYDQSQAKVERLKQYYGKIRHRIDGEQIAIRLDDLARDCFVKAEWMTQHIRTSEWISSQQGFHWFNGYYDNDGNRLEGDHPSGVRMTLTGQVFSLMGGIATDDQARELIRSIDHYLLDESVGGHRLNTNFNEVLFNMGRCFGFAFGHKENGAVFNHMVVMYAYALYERGFAQAGHQVLDRIYRHSSEFENSCMFPGIPEYFDARGRGVYPFLTGSASWYILTVLTQAYGLRGRLGDLEICPKLVAEQFNSQGTASIRFRFAGKMIEVRYSNPKGLDFGSYQVESVDHMGRTVPCDRISGGLCLSRSIIELMEDSPIHVLVVNLS